MKTRAKLLPGQKGTKSLQKQYGDALVCVRYRYDETNGKQLKTVEIIVSEKEWTPPGRTPPRFAEGDIVAVKIGVQEKSLQQQAKAVGGRWDPAQKVWHIPFGCIAGTELEKLIIIETKPTKVTSQSL